MKKLTKHQRQYRKRKKDSQKDFRPVRKNGQYPGVRVTRRRLKVWVSEKAFDRLGELAMSAGTTNWEILSRILLKGLPRYAYQISGASPLKRYEWPERLLNPTELQVKYKGSKGDRQISYDITSTAWKKLQCHKTATGLSKARIVQNLILRYKPLSKEQLEKQRWAREEEASAMVTNRQMMSSRREYQHSKLIDTGGGVIIHKKGIPIQHWDEAELAEYNEFTRKAYERNLYQLELDGKKDSDEYRMWERMKSQWQSL